MRGFYGIVKFSHVFTPFFLNSKNIILKIFAFVKFWMGI
nr:MAG TPA: hypothetical protein [Caudoviricetes sp.]